METTLIQMKIKLEYISPPIWRRFLVDSSITLHKLHKVIQIVMGWTDSHLHSFEILDASYCLPNPDEDFSDFEGEKRKNSKKVKLSQLSLQRKSKFHYTYDFGDNWEHIITVEDMVPASENTMVPICLEGQRACPPEDCGSVPGYEDILNAIRNPKKKDSQELLEWLGDYDPEKFDIEDINSDLRPKKIKRGRV